MEKNIASIAAYCLNCPKPRCVEHCPCGNAIPTVLSLYKEGKVEEAAKALYATNPFPGLTSLLCDHARQCKGNCIRGIRGEPVDFPYVERELSLAYPFPYKAGEPNGKKVAIIGAGPSALSAATFLLEAGFAVEIFEKQHGLGGAMLTGIPGFRLNKDALKTIGNNLAELGAVFHFGHEVKGDELDELSLHFDHVLVAIGAEKENRLACPQCPDIFAALSLLEDLNLREEDHGLKGKRVIVMGGGNVAMDISRSLRRRGAKVTLIYRRDEKSMPAQVKEILEAKEEGVVFDTLTNIADYRLDEYGRLNGLRLVKMKLGEPDASGRPSFSVIEGSEFDVDCDAFVMAIGEKSALDEFLNGRNIPNLTAIGDCSYGAKNIAAAIKSGREAAKRLIEELR